MPLLALPEEGGRIVPVFHERCAKVEDAAELAAFLKGLQP
jgi:hypothetical protein